MVLFYNFEAVVLQHSVTANFVTLFHPDIHCLDWDDLWDGLCISNFCLIYFSSIYSQHFSVEVVTYTSNLANNTLLEVTTQYFIYRSLFEYIVDLR